MRHNGKSEKGEKESRGGEKMSVECGGGLTKIRAVYLIGFFMV